MKPSHRRIETLLLILAVFIGEAQAQGGLDRDSLAAPNCNVFAERRLTLVAPLVNTELHGRGMDIAPLTAIRCPRC